MYKIKVAKIVKLLLKVNRRLKLALKLIFGRCAVGCCY